MHACLAGQQVARASHWCAQIAAAWRSNGESKICGIIGYVGLRAARPLLLDGLSRLEYRGYDSAGICFVVANGSGAQLERARIAGSVRELAQSLNGTGSDARCGIGHTRWATHGRVCIDNAHPLLSCDGSVAVALNGIVENFVQLRVRLAGEGHRFESDTDAEVVCHLIARHYQGDLVHAVTATAADLEGHFAFVCCHREHGQELVGYRRECPLVVGRGDGEVFIASSTTAFPAELCELQLVEDDEVVCASPADVSFHAGGRRLGRPVLRMNRDRRHAERGHFESLMLKEIHDQPRALRETIISFAADSSERHAWLHELHELERVQLVACGTAYHAALAARPLFERWARIPCQVDIASEWRYRDPLAAQRTLVCAISQSGETADTLAALRHANSHALRTLAITNMPDSQITREAERTLLTQCGLELSVAATKTFTAQVALLACLAVELGAVRKLFADDQLVEITAALRQLANQIEDFLVADHPIDEIAARHAQAPYVFFLGRQGGLPVAFEGALKLREIAYIPCEAHPAAEMKHGPIALIDEGTPVIVVATDTDAQEKIVSSIEEVRARGAEVLAIARDLDEAIQHHVDDVIYVPCTHPLLQPLLDVVPLQLLAHRIARLRGFDPDRPRNLAKTVTVE